MPEEPVISSRQVFLLIVFANIATVFFFLPGEITAIVGQDAWVPIFVATFVAAFIVYYPLADLALKYPDETMIQYSQTILGKYLGKILGFLFLYYFFQLHCWTLREFSVTFVALMPETPEIVFIAVMGLIIAYATLKGLEVIGRCAEFVYPIGMFFLTLVLVLSLFNMDFRRLQPVFEYSFGRFN